MSLIFTVPQSHCVVIERFGKFSRVCSQGLRVKIPFLESVRHVPEWGQVANKRGMFIELTEQQSDTPPRDCHTRDNVTVSANASIYWRIVDPVKALYEVDVLPAAISDTALNALRSNIGSLDLDTVLSERQRLNDSISNQLSQVGSKWGVHFTRVEIQELRTSDATADAMRQQMEAERRRRSIVAQAKGEAEQQIMLAQAKHKATVLLAEGEAKALELLAGAELKYLEQLGTVMDRESASRILLAQKMLESLEKISGNPAHKVFLPNDLRGMLMLNDGPSHSRENAQ